MTRTISDVRSTEDIGEAIIAEIGPMIAGERAAFAGHCHGRAISMAHLHLMTLLEANGSQPMSRVADLLGTGLPTATGLVTRMEERGLVERIRDDADRRIVLVRLTDHGTRELSDLQATRRRRMASAVALLSEAERVKLLASIRALRGAFRTLDTRGTGKA